MATDEDAGALAWLLLFATVIGASWLGPKMGYTGFENFVFSIIVGALAAWIIWRIGTSLFGD
jgi:hypothetical protein